MAGAAPSAAGQCEASIALQDMDYAHAAAAHHVAEPGAGGLTGALALHLARARLAAQLQRRLPDLGQAGRAAGVSARDQPAVGRHRAAAAELEVAALDALLRLARLTQPEQLVVLELLDDERVVHLHEVEVIGSQ